MYNSLNNKNILYVEDEIEVLNNIAEVLKDYFAQFYTATNGEDAYEIFLKQKIDILLVDIELPKMNGIELISKVRQKTKNINIVVISAYTENDYFLSCIEHKIDKYIIKPLTSKKIKQLLEKLDSEFHKNINNDMTILDKEFSFNHNTSQLLFNNNVVKLTKKEKELFQLLLEYRNSLVSSVVIELEIWPEQPSSATRIRSLISRLRAKLNHKFIETSSSEGYIFKCPTETTNLS